MRDRQVEHADGSGRWNRQVEQAGRTSMYIGGKERRNRQAEQAHDTTGGMNRPVGKSGNLRYTVDCRKKVVVTS
jgi:hypothetical protein